MAVIVIAVAVAAATEAVVIVIAVARTAAETVVIAIVVCLMPSIIQVMQFSFNYVPFVFSCRLLNRSKARTYVTPVFGSICLCASEPMNSF
jgi:hypothetical protein